MLSHYQSQLHRDLVTSLRSNVKGIFSIGEVKEDSDICPPHGKGPGMGRE